MRQRCYGTPPTTFPSKPYTLISYQNIARAIAYQAPIVAIDASRWQKAQNWACCTTMRAFLLAMIRLGTID
jgi:hypothetical protein